MVDIGGSVKTILTKEEYKEFTVNVDRLKQYENISVPHAVKFKGDNVEVSLLGDIDIIKLDNVLEKINLGVDNYSRKSYNTSNENQKPIRRK